MKQTIRIIGGTYRGKKLHFPEIEGLRPTPDRVRETLFNWLMNDIHNACVLDAFAGSGALGFEAFSRGASDVVFVDQSMDAHQNLKKIIHQFNSPKLSVIQTDALSYLNQSADPFDIIFLDPPYAKDCVPQCLDLIIKNSRLKKGGLVYIESSTVHDINTDDWHQLKLKQAGQVVYGLLRQNSPGE